MSKPTFCQQLVVTASLCSAVLAQNFQTVAAPLGINGLAHTTASLGTGLCSADFDGDGDIDVVTPGNIGAPFRIFRNDGGMQFTEVTTGSGLGLSGSVHCIGTADIDNDGDQDIYVGGETDAALLFINQGNFQFVESAVLRGIAHTGQTYGVTFGDYDRDGWLDIYVGNRLDPATGMGKPNILYRNTGGGNFVDVTASAGVGSNRMTFVVVFMDYNEDGWPDLIEVNDKGVTAGANELFRNNGDGTFTEVSAQFGTNIAIDGMGCDFLDVFNDGGMDFYCSDVPLDHLFQVWDAQLGTYTDATAAYGLQGGGIGWAVNWLDYDNDGWQDLHVVQIGSPNLLFKNPAVPVAPATPWTNQAAALAVDQDFSQFTTAVADYDDDGRMDLLHRYHIGPPTIMSPDGLELQRNTVAGGNWLKIRTEGTVSNRDGLGARVEVLTGTHRQRQYVRSGTGYLSNSDHRVHFGLGSATTVDRVTVTWPSGQVQYLTNLAVNQIVRVVEPEMHLSAPAQVGATTSLEVSVPSDAGLLYFMVMSFSETPVWTLPDGSVVPLAFDSLTSYTLVAGNVILPGSVGVLDAMGRASSPLNIPPLPFLAGLTVYGSAVTADMPLFPLLRTVFPTAVEITIQ